MNHPTLPPPRARKIRYWLAGQFRRVAHELAGPEGTTGGRSYVCAVLHEDQQNRVKLSLVSIYTDDPQENISTKALDIIVTNEPAAKTWELKRIVVIPHIQPNA